jgi:hypothetical protein
MHRLITAATLSLVLAGTNVLLADSGQAPAPDPKIGTRVTITGCLHEGTTRGSFVLLGVTERPAGTVASAQAVPYAIYWLDSNDGLKPFVGELVDITGKVTERRPAAGQITVSLEPGDALSKDVQVESADKALDITSKSHEGATRPSVARVFEMSRPVYKLAVDDVRAVAPPVPGPPCR